MTLQRRLHALVCATTLTLASVGLAHAGEAPDGSAAIPGPGESRQANPGGTTEGVNPAAHPAGKSMGGSSGSSGGTGGNQAPAGSSTHEGITPHEANAMAKGAQNTPTPPAANRSAAPAVPAR